jgi:hypothetical protein
LRDSLAQGVVMQMMSRLHHCSNPNVSTPSSRGVSRQPNACSVRISFIWASENQASYGVPAARTAFPQESLLLTHVPALPYRPPQCPRRPERFVFPDISPLLEPTKQRHKPSQPSSPLRCKVQLLSTFAACCIHQRAFHATTPCCLANHHAARPSTDECNV